MQLHPRAVSPRNEREQLVQRVHRGAGASQSPLKQCQHPYSMNLTVKLTRPSPDTPAQATNCFISLPSAVASSLWELKPRASLTILRVLRQQPGSRPVFVGWSGSTVPAQDTLGIHARFASALGLREHEVVEVQVASRVANSPPVSVSTAALRPVSYRASEGAPSSALAREQYASLHGTADILERSILPQIRVLYPGLTFPLTLPGGDCIYVEVTRLTLSTDANAGMYGVLVPGAELLIEPPPEPDQDDVVKVSEKFRVIPFSEPLRCIPSNTLLTHAVLPESYSTSVATRAARVSRRPLRGGDHVLPVSFLCHGAIPANHAWLPAFVWRDLRLRPLEPVFMEEVPMFSNAPDPVRVAAAVSVDPSLPSLENIRRGNGTVYNGMRLRNGEVIIGNKRETISRSTSDSEESSAGLVTSVTEVMANWEGTDKWRSHLDDTHRRYYSKMRVVSGWTIGESQNVTVSDDGESIETADTSKTAEDLTTFNPMLDDTVRMRLAESLTRPSRTAVHNAVRWASNMLSNMKGSNVRNVSTILLICGPEGSGKTLVCKTIAAILRSVGLLRTIWVQCSEKKEKGDAVVKRLQRAYDAAVDGGRGVVFLDDIDFWVGARHSEKQDPSEEPSKETDKDEHSHEILRPLRMTRINSVLSVITCRSQVELDESFRAPGVISSRLTLELPGREDMSVLRWEASLDTKGLSNSSFGSPQPDAESVFGAVTPSLEGYNAKEVQLLFSRAFSQIEPESTISQDQQVVRHLEKMISAMAPGSLKKGPRSHKKQASWTWKKIGGAEIAKNALTEVLLWPSRHYKLFERAPLSLPHGVLLYGPPGCGKTLLAKAAADESKMRCIVVKGPELMSKYIGESEAEVRRAFERASRLRPCVLLFDEFDSLAPRRGSGTGVTDRIVNTLLTCMDGAERLSQGVYLLATSSRPELIDPAALRPGRIDRWVPVEVPASGEERFDILKRLSTDFFTSSEQLEDALKNVSRATPEYTGADLGAILNDARIKLRKTGREKKLSGDEVAEAIGEALKESHPSMSHSERSRFRQVMESFGRSPGKGGKQIPSTQRVALK